MKLIFLGTGSAFTVGAGNYQSNMLLEGNSKKRLLLDCGSDIRHALFDLGYSYCDLDSVYISHLHSDHVGGLEWLAFGHYFDPACRKPTLFIPDTLKEEIWDDVLKGGLSSIQGISARLSTYFKVHPINTNGYFIWSRIKFHIVQTVHVMTRYKIVPSYGLIFNVNGIKVFLSTDTQFCPHQMIDFYNETDLIFHDCETAKVMSGVHAHYKELVTLDPAIKKKMWLYHYNPGELPNAKKDGFLGFVQKGQCFDFNDKRSLYR